MNAMTMLFWLLVGHAVADYPLQGDFLARGKNHTAPLPGVPWWICLANHAAIHAGAVAFITGSILYGLLEFVAHVAIDYAKCDGRFRPDVGVWDSEGTALADGYAFEVDQMLHVATKVAFAVALWVVPG